MRSLPLIVAVGGLLWLAAPAGAELDLTDTSRLRIGIGDRLSLERGGKWQTTLSLAEQAGLPVDWIQLWLPRGWKDAWVKPAQLKKLGEQGVTPVVVHYFFGDYISKERFESQRKLWYTSLWRMSQRIRGESPVLVILEPEFNNAPPDGETAITSWAGFASELRAAAKMIRREAPNALVGTCPGDFPGPPRLEKVLGPVANDLDFLAFQEMRGSTDPDRKRAGYLEVGASATRYARYLQRAFGRPLILGYAAVSSYGWGWEGRQRRALEDLVAHRDALLDAGVVGVLYFQLYDDPTHQGFFGEAEKHFGLLSNDGKAKPALRVFRALAR